MNVRPAALKAPTDIWDSCGWALLPGILRPDEVAALRLEADRLIRKTEYFDERGAVPFSPTRRDRLDPVIDLSDAFAELSRDPRLLDLAGSFAGGKVQLMKDKFIAKPPGASGYGTHQDGAYWAGLNIDPHRFLTIAVFLDDATLDKGPIECASGFHQAVISGPDGLDPDDSKLGPFSTIEAAAGDLLVLHALTPHRSGPNRSSEMRRALLFSYGVDDRPDLYGRYYQLKRSMCP